ncbi:MAG: hypothetical protein KDD83_10190 [Caldilineaceae bacterium]|nr:hypothetical protein [Caldilineaceae bacterium]
MTRKPVAVTIRPERANSGVLGRMLDPIDRLSETIYSILILLTFTFAFRIIKLGLDPWQTLPSSYIDELLIGALGATVAWGVIDGIMYALMSVFARGERHRLLVHLQLADGDAAAVDVLAEEFDHMLEPITRDAQRQLLYADILDHLRDSRPQPVGFTSEDFAGALGSVVVAVLAVLPSLITLAVLRHEPALAIRMSNVVSIVVLFIAGHEWGRYTGANPWKIGLLLAAVGVAMALWAFVLGG